uniref:Thioredoxin domain-containing protein n=1 Tax=Ditylenchus dipsaci TaxID=166011 RepID=A0A915DBT7_9BILA
MLVHNILLLLLISSLVIAEKAEENTESTFDTETEKSKSAEDTKSETTGNDLSHGFGKDIDWVDWKQAISIAMDVDKPIFLLIHKTWCGACKLLKQSFETSAKRLS